MIALGTAPTTLASPFRDASEGVQAALEQIQEMTGRLLFHVDSGVITPTDREGHGVDAVAVTVSAGEPLRAVAVGLLEDISLESAQNLLAGIYAKVLGTIGMNDRRKLEERVDVILKARPDLIVVAGGTEGGASKSVSKLMESVGLACYLLPEGQRPQVLYAGNSEVAEEIQAEVGGIIPVDVAPNVRPSLEDEQLAPAQSRLRHIYRQIRIRENAPLNELSNWSSGRLMPASQGFARIIRFFSKSYPPNKGVLGVDVGAGSTTIAAAFGGTLTNRVFSNLGLGAVLPGLLEHTKLSEIARWTAATSGEIHAYIQYKSAYPYSLPVTSQEMEIEQALVREILRAAIHLSQPYFPAQASRASGKFLPWFEPVVASGSALTNAPSRAQSLLMLLDGLELTGITTIVLDQFNLVSSLGASAELNPLLAVQVMDSGALLNLAMVIAPVSSARPGTPVLRLRVTSASGEEHKLEITQGSLEKISLHPGEEVKLSLQPLNRVDIGMGRPGLGGSLTIKRAGELGIIIDARGRPLRLPTDTAHRQELFKKWLQVLEG
ncbi:MAG: glutamate mutase L [Anaerolineales bacterium]